MPRVPFLGRLYLREYIAVIFSFLFIAVEGVLHIIITFLPKAILLWFHDRSRALFHKFVPQTPKPSEHRPAERIRLANDFFELCDIHGYSYEEHVVQTGDGYLLGLHRLPFRKGERKTTPGCATSKPVVYLHHGLLMCSDIWLCATSSSRCLPLLLVEAGYDVWLGNNRGNKYSKKSTIHTPNSSKFWNFSIDNFAWNDIPDSIAYILRATKKPSLSYVGFSQGTAQAFAALSIHPELNEAVDVFIALAPAMRPPGLAAPFVDALMKARPTLLYLFFGRKAILSSTSMWQSILYPPIFTRIIDNSLRFLFAWHGKNITYEQKMAAYAHLYSYASVKCVVHWFQIMKDRAFHMYDDDDENPMMSSAARFKFYRPAKYPTKNISTPIVVLYGTQDSLVDIETMVKELPDHTECKPMEGYEHVDLLWGTHVDRDVFPEVTRALSKYSGLIRASQNPQK